MFVIIVFWRLRVEDRCKIKASLSYVINTRPVKAGSKTLLGRKHTKIRQKKQQCFWFFKLFYFYRLCQIVLSQLDISSEKRKCLYKSSYKQVCRTFLNLIEEGRRGRGLGLVQASETSTLFPFTPPPPPRDTPSQQEHTS